MQSVFEILRQKYKKLIYYRPVSIYVGFKQPHRKQIGKMLERCFKIKMYAKKSS